MEETLDSVDDDELEEEADAEVDKVLFEVTDGKLGQAGKVGGELPVGLCLVHGHHVGSDTIAFCAGGEGGRGRGGGDAENAARDTGSSQWMRPCSSRRAGSMSFPCVCNCTWMQAYTQTVAPMSSVTRPFCVILPRESDMSQKQCPCED